MRPQTPEEKLLRLIRGKGAVAQAASAGAAPAAAPRALPIQFSISGWQWVTVLSVLLGLILLVEVVALILQFTRPVPSVEIRPAGSADAPSGETAAAQPIPSLAAAVQRPVFVSQVASTGGAAEVRPPSTDAKELASKLTLTGIITGDPPQAIIENTESKKTYFVSPGQTVDGAVVDKVLENRVILNLQGEKVELGL